MRPPWDAPEWKTTVVWQKLIQELKYDMDDYGVDSLKFKRKIDKFFETTLYTYQ